jgi:hypothetical protein
MDRDKPAAVLRFTANQAQIDSLNGTLEWSRYRDGCALLDGFTVTRFLSTAWQ